MFNALEIAELIEAGPDRIQAMLLACNRRASHSTFRHKAAAYQQKAAQCQRLLEDWPTLKHPEVHELLMLVDSRRGLIRRRTAPRALLDKVATAIQQHPIACRYTTHPSTEE